MREEAFVTLATNDSYAQGAIVLAESLRRTGTTRKICCIATTHDGITARQQEILDECFDHVFQVDELYSSNFDNLALLGRPELAVTFTKVMIWSLVQFEKIVFLDADMLVLQPVDDLFARPDFSACPDSGWPDCFNTGLFVCKPSLETLRDLLQRASTMGSFDGGDQGLLNGHFRDWSSASHEHRIPFLYNVTFSLHYSYKPAFMHFCNDIRIVHFIGPNKPWMLRVHDAANGATSNYLLPIEMAQFVKKWWAIYETSPYGKRIRSELERVQSFDSLDSGYGDSGFANYAVTWAPDLDYLNRLPVDVHNNEAYKIMPLMLEELAMDDSFSNYSYEDD